MIRIMGPVIAASLTVLAGCTVGPDFLQPESWSPASWFSATPAPDPAAAAASQPVPEPVRADWWAVFSDPQLTALENRVADSNLDVRSASLRLAQSRAQRRIAGAEAYPQVNGDAAYQRQRPSGKGIISLLGGGQSGSPTGGQTGGQGGTGGIPASGPAVQGFDLYQFGADASWEIDLWGRVRRSVEAADASIDAAADLQRDVLVSMLAEVAQVYLQLRGTQTQLRISRENLETARQSLVLTRQRQSGGLASELDVANAAAQLAVVRAAIPPLLQQQAALGNQLAFLLGQPPRALADELAAPRPVPPVPPRVPIGLPSELARRRPDIRAAEAQLHAQTAAIGVARADFYPRLTLNGNIDLQALRFADLGSWAARTYAIGPSLSLPIFEGGRLTGNLELTTARQQEAAVNYQRTVLNAWQEVDNALTAYGQEQQRLVDLTDAVARNRRALALARDQYRSGNVNFLEVLTAEQQLLNTQQQQASSTTAISVDLVTLYRALGGGWQTALPDRSGAPAPGPVPAAASAQPDQGGSIMAKSGPDERR